MKKLFSLALFATLCVAGFSQGYSGDVFNVKDKINLRGNTIQSLAKSPLDSSSFSISDSVLLSSKAIKLYIDKRLALCGCTTPVGPQVLAVAMNPSSATVTEGQSVTFSASATGGSAPYTHQWMKGSNPISGATSGSYSISSTVLGDAGSYSDIITDAASASVQTTAATLTVNALPPTITVSYAYSSSDPYVNNTTIPSVSYTATQNITHNQSLSYSWPQAATNKFLVIKVPAGESLKTTWYFTALNQGTIPDQGFRAAFTISGFTYYISRDALAFESPYTLLLQ